MNLALLEMYAVVMGNELPHENLNSKATSETCTIPVQSNGRTGVAVLDLHCNLPSRQYCHDGGHEASGKPSQLRPAQNLEVEEPPPRIYWPP